MSDYVAKGTALHERIAELLEKGLTIGEVMDKVKEEGLMGKTKETSDAKDIFFRPE